MVVPEAASFPPRKADDRAGRGTVRFDEPTDAPHCGEARGVGALRVGIERQQIPCGFARCSLSTAHAYVCCCPSQAAFTYTKFPFENNRTHSGAVYGLDLGPAAAPWDLGTVRHHFCGCRFVGHARGRHRRDLRL